MSWANKRLAAVGGAARVPRQTALGRVMIASERDRQKLRDRERHRERASQREGRRRGPARVMIACAATRGALAMSSQPFRFRITLHV